MDNGHAGKKGQSSSFRPDMLQSHPEFKSPSGPRFPSDRVPTMLDLLSHVIDQNFIADGGVGSPLSGSPIQVSLIATVSFLNHKP